MRYKLVNKRRFYTFLVISILFISLGILLLTNNCVNGENIDKYEIVVVQSGDTIWDIAMRHNDKYEDLREFVYIIKKENNIFGDTIVPNQILKIPKKL